MSRFVYPFSPGEAAGRADQKELLGGKGANLAEMCRLGLPVPAGFTLSTEVCTYFYDHGRRYPDGLAAEVADALRATGEAMGRRFGDAERPLLLSVRSGARRSMPGMMETVLNVGLTSATLPGLVAQSGDRHFAWDAYRRLVTMYADVVMEKAAGREPAEGEGIRDQLEAMLAERRRERGVEHDAELSADDFEELARRFAARVEKVLGEPFPDDAETQLWGAIGAVFRSWQGPRARHYRRIEGIPDDWGTAVNVQAMVFGNLGRDSASGVAFTRNPATGEDTFYGEWLPCSQGEDVVSGARTPYGLNPASTTDANRDLPTLDTAMPAVYDELEAIRRRLETRYRDMQDVEFTVESGRLWMLQTRTGKRNGVAAVRIAVEMAREGLIERREAVLRVLPEQLDELLHPRVDPTADHGEPLARGLPAGPGGARGRIVLTSERAQERAAAGEEVVLVRTETSAEDVHGMHAAVAIVTARGGMTSHAALVARGWGKTCVVGVGELEIDVAAGTVTVGDTVLHEGDVLTVDGTGGRLWARELELVAADTANDETLSSLLGWCDTLRRLRVRANADRPEDAAQARRFGAEGIGLCRTEHMFFGEERILAMREMILAADRPARERALAKLLPYQRADFLGLLREMAGLPVTIRLIDPPLHEFLPDDSEAIDELARDLGKTAAELRARIDELREANPMLGHRGCRLGITYPEITRTQTRAILEAAAQLAGEGVEVHPEIMVPLVGDVAELADQKRHIVEVAHAVEAAAGRPVPYLVGTMIEVPRAALTADRIAEEAEFFSFGTNDLTQMTCGFSRDDAGTFLDEYLARGIYAVDPFQSLDQTGVGQLVAMAVERGRRARPDLHLGICGEHGGDPGSIEFFHHAGLDYVSCSPFRVPIARLAAAQSAAREQPPVVTTTATAATAG